MTDDPSNEGSEPKAATPKTATPSRNRVGTWMVFGLLLLILVGTGVLAYVGLTSGNIDVPPSGYIAMALGVAFSLAVGIGLMVLVFYSSRAGYDEPAVLIEEPDAGGDDAQPTPEDKRTP